MRTKSFQSNKHAAQISLENAESQMSIPLAIITCDVWLMRIIGSKISFRRKSHLQDVYCRVKGECELVLGDQLVVAAGLLALEAHQLDAVERRDVPDVLVVRHDERHLVAMHHAINNPE